MNRKWIMTAMCITFTALSAAAYAQPPEEGGQEGGGRRGWSMRIRGGGGMNLARTLELTPEQQEALKTRRTEQKEKRTDLKEKLKAKRNELAQELGKGAIDEEKVNALVSEIKALTAQQIDQRVEGIMAMRDILTLEQFAKLQEMKKSRRGGRQRVGPRPVRR